MKSMDLQSLSCTQIFSHKKEKTPGKEHLRNLGGNGKIIIIIIIYCSWVAVDLTQDKTKYTQ
jgi:hypothetical protein